MLQTWTADRLGDVKRDGRTRPLVLGARMPKPDGTIARCDFVVKALGLPEVTAQSLFCEIFGNVIAQELGVETFEPAFVELDRGLVDDINAELPRFTGMAGIKVQPGLAVGTRAYAHGNLASVSSYAKLNPAQEDHALSIYCFDLLVQNPDREKGHKPNCGFDGDRIIAYDFELAFSFLRLLQLGTPEPPWNVTKHGIYQRHLFHAHLRKIGSGCNFEPFLSLLDQLTDLRLEQLSAMLPIAWAAWAKRASGHIAEVRSHRSEFEWELRRTLA